MQPILTKISMILLKQPDLEAAVLFYKNLGLTLKFHVKDVWAEFEVGQTKLGLYPTKESSQDGERTGVVFEVPDIKKFYEYYKDSLAFLGEPVEKVHGIMVCFKDPGGNIIDIYQPTPEKVKEFLSSIKSDTTNEGGCCGSQNPCCSSEEEGECDSESD